jgi:hypothetical protein
VYNEPLTPKPPIEGIKKREDVQLVELVESRPEILVEQKVGEIEDLYAQGKG